MELVGAAGAGAGAGREGWMVYLVVMRVCGEGAGGLVLGSGGGTVGEGRGVVRLWGGLGGGGWIGGARIGRWGGRAFLID